MFEYKPIEDSQSEEGNTGGWRRAWAKIFGPVAVMAALTGCVQEVTSPAPSAIETQAPSPDGSPSSTEVIEKSEIEKKFEMAPVIEGLNKEIQEKDEEKRVVYLFESDNPFGGTEGAYAGEYSDKVDFYNDFGEIIDANIRQAVVLVPEVVDYYLEFYRGYLEDRAAVPLDISKLGKDERATFRYVEEEVETGGVREKYVINFDGSTLPLVCVGQGKEDLPIEYEIRNLPNDPTRGWMFDVNVQTEGVEAEEFCGSRFYEYNGYFSVHDTSENQWGTTFGPFEYGDKICDVTDELVITRGRAAPQDFLDIPGTGVMIFMGEGRNG
ncbi:MAG: hypothetical protein WDA65_05240 [Christensenellales bacterium]